MRLTLLGIVIAALGALALYFGGIPYTDEEHVVEVGPVTASAEVQKEVDIPPLAGGAILALGVGIAVYGARRN